MTDVKSEATSVEEARRFAVRIGLAWADEQQLEALAAAMTTSIAAGKAVPRVESRMAQPAPIFRVAAKVSLP